MRRFMRGLMPRTFQGRLTIAFVAVVVLTLLLVALLVINRLDDYFTKQQERDLHLRAQTVATYVQVASQATVGLDNPVVHPDGVLDPRVVRALELETTQRLIADRLGQADVVLVFGMTIPEGEQSSIFLPAIDGAFEMPLLAPPEPGQSRQDIVHEEFFSGGRVASLAYSLQVTLSNPYTSREAAIANVTGLLAAIGLFALGLSVVVAAALARRFTTPLRTLTDASRAIAEGDLGQRVPTSPLRTGSSEIGELAVQFNTMADRLQESVEIIRHDRDRSRDFLADVSHELRTPLAALRTFNQLLMESAGDDPDARAEFLESSAGQIDRLDWLAQNLLELSKLDSGLVLLDLRPDDLRAAVESAAHQLDGTAARRGVTLTVDLPATPIRIRHDPPRIGQVVTNLVGNAVKFTPRGGSVRVTMAPTQDGARIDVTDTGVGIDPTELPHIFDRFYRGSRANEARGSGSGLGLAIVRSIVDIHGGSVEVESGAGTGSRFTVRLPADPRTVAGTPAAVSADVASAADAEGRRGGSESADPSPDEIGQMTETSPSDAPKVNPSSAP
jgi:signal transduction histidine kinase